MNKESLPRNWGFGVLGDLGDWRGGGTPSKAVKKFWENGTIHWVSPKDMKRLLIDSAQDQITAEAVQNSATSLIPKNSVLMVTRSGILAHTFPVGINTVPVAVNQDLKAWTPYEGLDPTYVAYYLIAQNRDILHSCSKDGTTVNSIEFDRLSAYNLKVAPLKEQKRIVSRIDELFSEIEEGERALRRVQKLVERYRQSVLKAAVTGELTREWREKYKGQLESGEALLASILKARRQAWEKSELDKMKARGQKPADSEWKDRYTEPSEIVTDFLDEIPDDWIKVRIDTVGEVQLGRQRAPQHHSGEFMRQYLRVANVFEELIDTSDVMSMNFSPDEFHTYQLRNGDILLNEGQSKELVGRPAIYRNELPKACFTNTLVRFRSNSAVKPEFALLVFLHYMKAGYFQNIAKITTNIAHLGAGRFAEMSFPVPSLEEQQQIISIVGRQTSNYKHLLAEVKRGILQATALRQSVLKAAFSGQLAPQDPNDEPASVLLERIAAERKQQMAKATNKSNNKSKKAHA